jgi:hypothetical protein
MSSFRLVSLSFLSFAMAMSTSACDDSVVIVVQTGARPVGVDLGTLTVPDELRDEQDGQARLVTIPCGPSMMCPSIDLLPITCEESVCDPAPKTMSMPIGEVVDIDTLAAEARGFLRHVEAIEILEARYEIQSNTLTTEIPAVEIFWGPESATEVDPSMGVVALGVLAAIPAGSLEPGTIALDPGGVEALSDYLVWTSRRVRLLARTTVDLSPGDVIPEGALDATVDLRLRITGSLLR